MNLAELRLHANISWKEPEKERRVLKTRNATVSEVKFCAGKAVGLSVKELDSDCQKRDYVTGRMLIMRYLTRQHGFSLAKTGKICGLRDHATVLNSNKRYKQHIESNDAIILNAKERFNYELLKISKTINTL